MELHARRLLECGSAALITLSDGQTQSVADAAFALLNALPVSVRFGETATGKPDGESQDGLLGSATGDLTPEQNDFLSRRLGVDPAKFLIYSYQPKYGNPYGVSDLRSAWRSWSMKEQLLTWWGKYLEKFGMPTVTGEYDGTKGYTTAQQQQFLSVVSQVHNEAALIFPSDLKVSVLEGKSTTANGGSFDVLVSYLDRAIAKSILVQSLTSDSSARGSTYALGAVQENVLRFYLNKLGKDLEEAVMTRQLLARLVAFNFPVGTPTPSFRLGKIDDDRLAVVGKLIADLVAGQVIAPGEPWIRDYLGLPAVAVAQTS